MGFDDFRGDEERESVVEPNPYAGPPSIFADEISLPPESPGQPASKSLPHPHLGWAVLWVFGFWCFQVAISLVAVAVIVGLAIVQGPKSPDELVKALEDSTTTMIPLGTFSSVLFAVFVAWIFYRAAFANRLALRGMSPTQWVATLLIVLPMSILASEVTNCAGEVLPHFNSDVLEGFASAPLLLVLLAGCVFPAVGEEILCRGFLGRGLIANHGVVLGVFLASLLFGILHVDPVQSIGAFTLGLGLHFAYLTTRSLCAPLAIHFLNNASAFILIRNFQTYPLPGLTPLPDGSPVHTPLLVLLFAGAALVCLGLILRQSRTHFILPDGSIWSPGYVTAEAPPSELPARAESSSPDAALLLATPVVYAALLWALYSAYHSAVDPTL